MAGRGRQHPKAKLVAKNPGQSVEQNMKALDVTTKDLQLPIVRMVAAKKFKNRPACPTRLEPVKNWPTPSSWKPVEPPTGVSRPSNLPAVPNRGRHRGRGRPLGPPVHNSRRVSYSRAPMKRFLAVLPFVLVSACQSSQESDVPWRSLARSPSSGVVEAGAHVARDGAEWRALWSRHTQAVVQPAQAPALDLERDMAILVSDGEKPTAGWSLEVTAMTIEHGELVVHALVVAPPADMLQAQVITAPCELVATTRHKLPVRVNIAR